MTKPFVYVRRRLPDAALKMLIMTAFGGTKPPTLLNPEVLENGR